MPWHPPIPFGALYTEEAIKVLGPALALLGYCYDTVERSGWAKFSLRQAAMDMHVSYATVKRWWDALKDTDYISEYRDHRRGGMEIRIADQWLDWWREERYEKGADVSLLSDEIDQKSSKKGPKKGADVSLNPTAYKVLNNTDQAESHGGGEDRDGTARTHPPKESVALYFAFYPSETLSAEQTDDICSTVDDLALWRQKLTTWRANGYKPRVGNLLDSYRKDLAKGAAHGAHHNGRSAGRVPDLAIRRTRERLDE